MGGLVFSQGPNSLYTPRMPPDVYDAAKQHCLRGLSKHFGWVSVPQEGPGKQDHGDVDVLVYGARWKARCKLDVLTFIKEVLGAHSMIVPSSTLQNGHFSIPWPAGFPVPSPPLDSKVSIIESEKQKTLLMLTTLSQSPIQDKSPSQVQPSGIARVQQDQDLQRPERSNAYDGSFAQPSSQDLVHNSLALKDSSHHS